MKKIVPNRAKVPSRSSPVAADSETERNSFSGSTGCVAISSRTTNPASSTANAANDHSGTGSPNPYVPALIKPQTRANSDADSSATPEMSKDPCAPSSRDSRTTHRPTSRAMRPSGALRKKTDSQLTCWTSSPPTIGPPAMETPTVAPQMPIAALSRCGGRCCG